MRKLTKVLARWFCAVALALACVPAASFAAFADVVASGDSFVVGNYEYKVTVSSVRYVQFKRVVNPSAEGKIIDVPQSVQYDGETYTVVGIDSTAFLGCTQVEDIRIPDLKDGLIHPEAFGECSSLEAIHLMGDFAFSQPMHYHDTFGSLASVKFIVHKGNWCYNEISGVDFPPSSQAYYGIDFVQGNNTQTVYVAGPKRVNGVTSSVTTVYDLLTPSSVDVYCDMQEGSQALCTVSSVPVLTGGNDSWLVVNSNNSQLRINSDIRSTGTATAMSSTDLRGATFSASDLFVNGDPLSLETSLIDSTGKSLVLGEDYTVSVKDSSGAVVEEIVETGAYTVTATGIGKYSQETSCTLMVFAPSSVWYRSLGSGAYDLPKSISSQASLIKSQSKTDSSISYNSVSITTPQLSGNSASRAHRGNSGNGTVENTVRVLLNSNDCASSVIGVSLAGLFDSTVIVSPAALNNGELNDSVKEQLSIVRNGTVLVMGSSSQISEQVKTEVSYRVNGGATRIGGSAKSAAEEAVAAYQFVRGVESGKYSLTLPEEYTGYSDTVVVIPDNNSQSAIAAATWAYVNNALVLFCKADGSLDEATKGVLTDADSEGQPYFNKVVVAGASSSAIASALPELAVEEWAASGDAIEDVSQWTAACVASGTQSYGVSVLADSSSSWGVLAAAACTAGCHDGALLLTDISKGEDAVVEAVASVAWKISYGVLAGGLDQYPQNLFERITRLWDFDTDTDTYNMRFSEVTVLTPQIKATGKAVEPSVQVVDKTGKMLVEGTDYTVSYLDNATGQTVKKGELVSPGSYTVVATGTYKTISGGFDNPTTVKGYYQGSRSGAFTIVQAAPGKVTVKSMAAGKKKLTVAWTETSGATKYQVSYRVKGTSSWKTASAKSAKVTISKLKSGKTYQVRVRAGNGSGWGAWSAVKTSKKIK